MDSEKIPKFKDFGINFCNLAINKETGLLIHTDALSSIMTIATSAHRVFRLSISSTLSDLVAELGKVLPICLSEIDRPFLKPGD